MRELVGVVLAAGEGRRLRPLTELRPKPLCPVNNVPLLDLAIARVRPFVAEVAVNAHYRAEQIVEHLSGTGVHVSVEAPQALGTAGALGALRDWIAGRDVLVHNGDAWLTDSLHHLVDGWSHVSCRLLVQPADGGPADFGSRRFVGVSLVPASMAADLPPRPLGLYEALWRDAWARGELELWDVAGPAIDCGTIADYLRANLLANGGASVVGRECRVLGELQDSVLWDGATVEAGERLVRAIRTPGVTVQA